MPKKKTSLKWAEADEISDRIIDLMNARLKAGIDVRQLLAGQLLGLIGFLRTSPRSLALRPDSFNRVGVAAEMCLEELIRSM